MDRQEQEAGEKRVRSVLVDPLIVRGLGRPPGTVAAFEAGLRELCQKLAYMSAEKLGVLAYEISAEPDGRHGDRFWKINRILNRAAEIEPPADSASPLLRAVFADRLGQGAVAEGWAPELRKVVRDNRRWPAAFAVQKAREDGLANARRMQALEERAARGAVLEPGDAAFLERRRSIAESCAALAREVSA